MCFSIDIEKISDLFVAIAATGGLYIAWQGLDAWKNELKGRSRYAIAKDVLKAVYKVRNAFSHVRGPIMFSSEYPDEFNEDRFGGDELKNRRTKFEARQYAYGKRWEHLHAAFSDLKESLLNAEVEWGGDLSLSVEELRKCQNDLLFAVQDQLRQENPDLHSFERYNNFSYNERQEILYELENDLFTQKIKEAVSKIEIELRGYIN